MLSIKIGGNFFWCVYTLLVMRKVFIIFLISLAYPVISQDLKIIKNTPHIFILGDTIIDISDYSNSGIPRGFLVNGQTVIYRGRASYADVVASKVVGGGGITLITEYTDTQLVIKFAAPSTDTVIINWGSDSIESVVGQDGTLITKTSPFTSAGTYVTTLQGDADSITKLYLNDQNHVSGRVRPEKMPNLSVLYLNTCKVSCNISAVAQCAAMDLLQLKNNDYIYGDISDLRACSNMRLFQAGNSLMTFDDTIAWEAVTSQIVWIIDEGLTSAMVDKVIKAWRNCTGDFHVLNCDPRTVSSNDDLSTLLENANLIYLPVDTISQGLAFGPELHMDSNAASDPNGNESDATTGWSETGLTIESTSDQSYSGTYSLRADDNTSPTANCNIYQTYTTETDSIYCLTFNWRHVETGLVWGHRPNNLYENLVIDYTIAGSNWLNVAFWRKATGTSYINKFQEQNTSNNGGIYVDNVSMKKVTFSE